MDLKQGISTRPTVEFRLLGGFDVLINGQPLPPLRSRKVRWLLALLALRLGRGIPRDRLAETLWPDSEAPKALFNLRQELSALRRALGSAAPCLCAPTPHTLTLDSAGVWTDVAAFDTAIAQGERATLEQAVALYRGSLLPDCQEDWVLR